MKFSRVRTKYRFARTRAFGPYKSVFPHCGGSEFRLREFRSRTLSSKSSYLRIGVSTHRGARILPILLPKVKAEYPNVKIQLVEKRLGELKRDLLDGKINLMFGYKEEAGR